MNRFTRREYLDETIEPPVDNIIDEEQEDIPDGVSTDIPEIQNESIPEIQESKSKSIFNFSFLKKILIIIVIILALYLLYVMISKLMKNTTLADIMDGGKSVADDFLGVDDFNTPTGNISTDSAPIMPTIM